VDDAGAFGEAGGDAGGDGADGRRGCERGVFGVDGVGVVGAEAEGLDGAGVGHELGLPAVIGLILLHGGFGGRVPMTVGIFAEIVLADEGGLDFGDALGLNCLLAVKALAARDGGGSLAGAGDCSARVRSVSVSGRGVRGSKL